jgi:hypothetical protein
LWEEETVFVVGFFQEGIVMGLGEGVAMRKDYSGRVESDYIVILVYCDEVYWMGGVWVVEKLGNSREEYSEGVNVS